MNSIERHVLRQCAFQNFDRDADSKLGHAYLLISEDGISRAAFLSLAAKRAFCKNICGECEVCRAIDEGTYPDVYFLNGAEMKVRDMTAMTENAAVKPVVGEKKIYLIDNAGKLSPQAQNKLLKTYEEPPYYVTVILAAADENGLLNTIKSRAKKIYLENLSAAQTAEILIDEGADKTQAEIAAAVSAGNLERAEQFLLKEGYAALYDRCFEMFAGLNSSSSIVDYLYSELFTKENILITLDFMEIILCDVMKIASKSGAVLQNSGREYDLRLIAEKFTAQSAAMSLYAVNEGRKKLNFNINSASCAEGILFDILEARYKWQQ